MSITFNSLLFISIKLCTENGEHNIKMRFKSKTAENYKLQVYTSRVLNFVKSFHRKKFIIYRIIFIIFFENIKTFCGNSSISHSYFCVVNKIECSVNLFQWFSLSMSHLNIVIYATRGESKVLHMSVVCCNYARL